MGRSKGRRRRLQRRLHKGRRLTRTWLFLATADVGRFCGEPNASLTAPQLLRMGRNCVWMRCAMRNARRQGFLLSTSKPLLA